MANNRMPMGLYPASLLRGTVLGGVRKSMTVLSVIAFGLLFPALVLFGGSTNLINWGPGLLLAGVACLWLIDNRRQPLRRGDVIHPACFLLLLGLLFIRAQSSPDASAAANNAALIALAAAGYLIGKSAGVTQLRALFVGLSLVSMLNLVCAVIQMGSPEWNLIYPQRTGGFPSGLFAHYSYSAAFCLGTLGLLMSRIRLESTWLKPVLIGGAICALVTIPISLSRGGNLALAFMIAMASALLLARAFWKTRSVVNTWLPVGVLLALFLIFGFSFVPLIGRNQGFDGFYADSVRLSFWKAATQIAADHPWIGAGAGGFAREVFHVMSGLSVEPGMTHNEALQVVVDYGYPALIAIAALIAVPVVLCFWRFVNKADAGNASWAAAGLVAMLVQSNFESIFHSGPGAFVAALILGWTSRSVWANESPQTHESSRLESGGGRPDQRFLLAVQSHVHAYLAGDAEAVPKLVGLLSRSTDSQWRRGAYRLTYWAKVHNEEVLRQINHRPWRKMLGRTEPLFTGRRIAGGSSPCSRSRPQMGPPQKAALAGCAIPIVLSGTQLSQALIQAWVPDLSSGAALDFEAIQSPSRLGRTHPGLGIDRKVLDAA